VKSIWELIDLAADNAGSWVELNIYVTRFFTATVDVDFGERTDVELHWPTQDTRYSCRSCDARVRFGKELMLWERRE
jgi:hypothetical protein